MDDAPAASAEAVAGDDAAPVAIADDPEPAPSEPAPSEPLPVEPLPGQPAVELPEPVHTISLYLSAKNQDGLLEGVLASGAVRVIFNPGTENPELEDALRAHGIEPLRACTLVLLRTGQFNP